MMMCPNNYCIYRKSMRYSNKCVAKLSWNKCKVTGLLIWAFFIAAAKSYVYVTNIFKICYKRYLSFRLQKINEKVEKDLAFFGVKKEWVFCFSNSRGMIIFSEERRVIFKSDFQDGISKQRSVKWKWFFNQNLKNVA